MNIIIDPKPKKIFDNEKTGYDIDIVKIEHFGNWVFNLIDNNNDTTNNQKNHKIVKIFFIRVVLVFKEIFKKALEALIAPGAIEPIGNGD